VKANAPRTRRAAIRVLVADDHAVEREGIRQVLSEETFDVIAEARDGAEAIALAKELAPDVVVLDLSMPNVSGLDACARIREALPDTRVLVLSIHDHEEYVLRSVRAGAHGFLRKDSTPAELRRAVRDVYAGESALSAPVARTLSSAVRNEGAEQARQARMDALTARERGVLVEIARGGTNKQIAERLGISPRTVESHREALMKKLDVKGVASLTRFAIDAGLLRDNP
jgi:DNA-binding NarL/FixJ family response regulator